MNVKIIRELLVYLAIAVRACLTDLRVWKGVDDTNYEFPFVVSVEVGKSYVKGYEMFRYCTGSLIASDWVLTAAHCIDSTLKFIRFGNMSIPNKKTKSKRRVLRMIAHPSYKNDQLIIDSVHNDIGLLFVEKVPDNLFGKLSAVDYKALMGIKVRYAGFGRTYGDPYNFDDVVKSHKTPLQVGEGIVAPCYHDEYTWGPAICVVAKCKSRDHDSLEGDSGGPVFLQDRIVAVISGGIIHGQGIQTPVSPYINWINLVINNVDSNYMDKTIHMTR